MKIRTGFVSNSSTSSFICDVCGDVEAGYDGSLSDFDMRQCINGHTWHIHHMNDADEEPTEQEIMDAVFEYIEDADFKKYYFDDYKELIACTTFEELEEAYAYDSVYRELYENYSEVPKSKCEFCKLNAITQQDAFKYLMRLYNYKTLDEILARVKNEFNSYEEFLAYLRS